MKKNKKIQLIISIIWLFLFVSCNHDSNYLKKLDQIDSLMESHPKASYDSLCLYKKWVKNSNQKVEMKYRTLVEKAKNILFIDMAPDTSFQQVMNYYEKKGTSKEKMMAHYLLGCVYRDKKEAPFALQSFSKAIEYADTLDKYCDYSTLYRIYGQMSEIYSKQSLFNEAAKAEKMYSLYAIKANDTLNYLTGIERLIPLYYSMGDTGKVISSTFMCAKLYQKYKMPEKSAGVYTTLIAIYLAQQRFKKAHYYMRIFENQAGLFDKNGDIAKHREHYYSYKGQYFLGIHQLDSAEFYFRKLSHFGYSYEVNRGLLAVYKRRNMSDSIIRFAGLCELGLDSILNANQTIAVKQVSALYDYNRLQNISTQNQIRAKQAENKSLIVTLLLLGLAILTIWGNNRYQKSLNKKKQELLKQQREVEKWNEKYWEIIKELEQNKEELCSLHRDKEAIMIQKQNRIEQLEKELQEYEQDWKAAQVVQMSINLDEEAIYKKFKLMVSGKRNAPHPNGEDWKNLTGLFKKYYPLCYKNISQNVQITQLELYICMLTRLGFANGDMVILLNSSQSSISNIKSRINKRLFNCNGSRSLFDNMAELS